MVRIEQFLTWTLIIKTISHLTFIKILKNVGPGLFLPLWGIKWAWHLACSAQETQESTCQILTF